jgi:putative ABC transport system ATP-binding protein
MADRHQLLRVDPIGHPLEAERVYRFFHAGAEEVLALRGVTLSVGPGEMLAVVGPSGSGKSTLLSCLAGLDQPEGGTVDVAGHRVSRVPEVERAALRARYLGVLFQSVNLIEHLTVSSNLSLAQRLAGHVDRARTAALLDRLGLSGRARAYPSQLSGGEAVRAGLALALANDPPVLLADEPTAEVDSKTEEGIVELLLELAADGMAVVVFTHSDAVAGAAHRVLRLVDGEVAL